MDIRDNNRVDINPLNAELNPIRHLLALVGARHIVHVSRIRANIYTHSTATLQTLNSSMTLNQNTFQKSV